MKPRLIVYIYKTLWLQYHKLYFTVKQLFYLVYVKVVKLYISFMSVFKFSKSQLLIMSGTCCVGDTSGRELPILRLAHYNCINLLKQKAIEGVRCMVEGLPVPWWVCCTQRWPSWWGSSPWSASSRTSWRSLADTSSGSQFPLRKKSALVGIASRNFKDFNRNIRMQTFF